MPATLEEFLVRHPRPSWETGRGSPQEWYWTVDMAGDPVPLWEAISDTSRLNRALGLPQMQFREDEGELRGTARIAGVRHDWVEAPWEWNAPTSIGAVRHYSRGFFRSVRVVYELESLGDGSRLHIYFSWVPRGVAGSLLLRLARRSTEAKYRETLSQLERDDEGGGLPEIFHREAPELAPEASDRIREGAEELAARTGDLELSTRLSRWLASADDLDADRIQVKRLAREWRTDPKRLLRLCLHATRLGLLELRWDLVCPHCRGVRSELENLSQVPARGSCDVCDIDFDTDAETAIEVTFRVHPAIRSVPKVVYCSAEPAKKRHILVQQVLAPGEERELTFRLPEGSYRMRVRGQEGAGWLNVSSRGPAEAMWPKPFQDKTITAAPSGLFRIVNHDSEERTFVIEIPEWSEDALRVSELFTLQQFRDLFSEEYIATGVHLSVGEQTILFSDVVGSSRVYESAGDAEAFSRVREHFVRVGEIIGEHDGAVVKTIGDAAMASFPDPPDGFRAAIALQDEFADPEGIRLRISLHNGSCIAVQLNSSIDFFGTAVNRAAKLQRFAGPGDVVISEELRTRLAEPAGDLLDGAVEIATAEDSSERGRPVYRFGAPNGMPSSASSSATSRSER